MIKAPSKLRLVMGITLSLTVITGLYVLRCWQFAANETHRNKGHRSEFHPALTLSFTGEPHFHTYHTVPAGTDTRGNAFAEHRNYRCVHLWKNQRLGYRRTDAPSLASFSANQCIYRFSPDIYEFEWQKW